MAASLAIPVSDHSLECSIYYLVEYKLAGDPAYTSTGFQTATAVEEGSPLVTNYYLYVHNLIENVDYDLRTTRYCCDGNVSTPTTSTVNTTP